MGPIQFYRSCPADAGTAAALTPAFRRLISAKGPRSVPPSALRAVDVVSAAGQVVTLLALPTPSETFFAGLNGEDPSTHLIAPAALSTAPLRRLRQPSRGAPAALPGSLTAGTRVGTPKGCTPVERLAIGSLVTTCDGPPARIVCIGRATHVARGGFAPVTLPPGTFGPTCPAAPLSVSPLQLVLLRGARAQIFFGADEVLAPAASLPECAVDRGRGALDVVTYYTLLLDRPALFRAEGYWLGSYHPAEARLLEAAQGTTDPALTDAAREVCGTAAHVRPVIYAAPAAVADQWVLSDMNNLGSQT